MSAPVTPVTDVEISIGLRRAVVGVALMGAAVVLGILIAVEADPLDIDTWWNGGVSNWAPGLAQLAFALDFIGGGWVATYVVPIGGALLLVALRRP
ncbi:MAG: phosphatase PAP2 family protein, partial [Microbacterium sp.]